MITVLKFCILSSLIFLILQIPIYGVYADKSSTFAHLETNIRQVMAAIPPNVYQKVFENCLKRINACNTFRLFNKKEIS